MTDRRRLALLAGGLLALGVVVLAGLVRVAASRPDRLLAAAGKRLGRRIEADRVGVSLRGGLGVALTGVRIADDPAFGTEPFVRAARLEMRMRVLPLLRGRVVVDRVVVDQPVVRIVRDAAGRLNVDSFARRPKSPRPASTPRPKPSRGPAFQLANLRLRDGTVQYRERGRERGIDLLDLAIDARTPRFGAPVPVSVRARLVGRDVRLDDLQSEGTLDLAGERPAYRGALGGGPGAIGALPIDRLDARVRVRPPTLVLEDATVALLRGTVTTGATVVTDGAGAGVRGEVEGKGLDLAAMPGRADRPQPAGILTLSAKVAGPPPGAPDFRRALTGGGRFQVEHGRVANLPLGRTLAETLGPIVGGGTIDRLAERYPDLFSGDEVRFTQLSGSWRLADGRIASDDLALVSTSYAAHGVGSLGLDGDLDVHLTLTASPALTDDLLGRSRVRATLVDTNGQLTVPLRVRGPLRHPRVTPETEFAARVAKSVLHGTGFEDLASDVLDRFLKRRKRH
ncbi:MAG TPA: AsmA-like C-terminal region-containing protein [Candidatus Binatia bacterium]|nr:AsmA-like C-terminal region-containing protein [Candidatus Binatia bacterium]